MYSTFHFKTFSFAQKKTNKTKSTKKNPLKNPQEIFFREVKRKQANFKKKKDGTCDAFQFFTNSS